METSQAYILAQVAAERARQDSLFGGAIGIDRFHPDDRLATVLGEEFGEVCRAALDQEHGNLRLELIQVAAVAVAWVEQLDRVGMVSS